MRFYRVNFWWQCLFDRWYLTRRSREEVVKKWVRFLCDGISINDILILSIIYYVFFILLINDFLLLHCEIG